MYPIYWNNHQLGIILNLLLQLRNKLMLYVHNVHLDIYCIIVFAIINVIMQIVHNVTVFYQNVICAKMDIMD